MPTLDGKLCVPKGRPHRAAAGEGEFTHPLVHADWLDEHGQQDHADLLHALAAGREREVMLPGKYGHDMRVRFWPAAASGKRGALVTVHPGHDWWQGFQDSHNWVWTKWDHARGQHVPAEPPPHVVDAFHEAVAKLAPHRKRMARAGAARRHANKPATSESFIAALKDMRTKKQTARREVAHTVATQAGIVPHTFHDAIHDRVDGRATPSVVHHYPNAPSAQTARYSAAWFGLITGLEGVAVFFPDPKGPDFLYEFHAQGSGEVLRQRLDRAGIGDRVLMPKRGGFTVMVLDQGGTMGDRVRRYAGGNVTAVRGRAERMGGDSPVQARDEYRKLIKGYEVAAQKARVHGGLRRYAIRDSQGEPDGRGE